MTTSGFLSPERLKAAVEALEASVPEGDRHALMAVATKSGIQLRAATKIGDTWTLGLTVEAPYHDIRGITGEFLLVRSW